MSAKLVLASLALLAAPVSPANDALSPTRLSPEAAVEEAAAALEAMEREDLAIACKDREGWSDAAPPARIYGNTYYIGTCGISVLLVTTPHGHAIIDGATAEAAPQILANIRALGFDPADVRVIVGSHEHLDHMGGFAALKAATGARLLVSEAARPVVESGIAAADDPQAAVLDAMAPVAVDGVVHDGDPVEIGTSGFLLYPTLTPGHTSGGTSWHWQSCEGGTCLSIAYVDSLTAISADSYRFTDHPERVAPFRRTFAQVHAMPCDILITPHPSASNLLARMAGAAPLSDSTACEQFSQAMAARLDARLAAEETQE